MARDQNGVGVDLDGEAQVVQGKGRDARDDALALVLVEMRLQVFGKDLANRVPERLVVFVECGTIAGVEHDGTPFQSEMFPQVMPVPARL